MYPTHPDKLGDMDLTGINVMQGDAGARGIMLNMYAKQRPEYIEAADMIAESFKAGGNEEETILFAYFRMLVNKVKICYA